MRSFLIFVVILLQLLLLFLYKSLSGCCATGPDTVVPNTSSEVIEEKKNVIPPVIEKAAGPILFGYGSSASFLGKDWENYKNEVLSKTKDAEIIELTGLYSKDEPNPEGFNNMGEARADEFRKQIGLDPEKCTLKGIIDSKVVTNKDKFEAVRYSFKNKVATVEEKDRIAYIRFPYNSTNKLKNDEIEAYLDNVAAKVVTSGQRIKLTGHTDDRGNATYNKNLGQKRADIIKNYLVSKGVDPKKITTASFGEDRPIASNSSEAGRAENRRTELEIIN